MIIEELFEFNRNVLSKEKNAQEKYAKMGEFLHAKGFKSAESQQLLIDCLDDTDQDALYFAAVAMFLAIIFAIVIILSNTSEMLHPVLFTISAIVIVVLLTAIFLIVKQIVSNERRKISNLIRRKINDCRFYGSEN